MAKAKDNGKRKRGHPVTVYTPERLQEIAAQLEKYIEETELPIVAEFAYKNNIRRDELYQHPELDNALKKLINKKETALEKGAIDGTYNASMAIFSLKQLGWRDRYEHAVDGPLTINVTHDKVK